MVYNLGVQLNSKVGKVSFRAEEAPEKTKSEDKDTLLIDEKHPALQNAKNKADKFVKSFTTYPKKGLKGSKNSNFYEFLSMGTVPYLVGSAMMIAVFNGAVKFFDTPASANASKLGKKMGIGVALYGLAKTFSKKLIETPVKLKHGIDVNMPYQKAIFELPDDDNKDNLVSYESHKVYESVDFPRWDLLYDNKKFGENRNAYYDKVAKKMNIKSDDIEFADQKVKPLIRKKVVQTKVFSTLASYLWAAVGVGVAMQKPWENLNLNLKDRAKNFAQYTKNHAGDVAKNEKYATLAKDVGKTFVKSCKEFVNNPVKANKIAGITLLSAAAAATLIGNFVTLSNFNKDRGATPSASTKIFDSNREKVVC